MADFTSRQIKNTFKAVLHVDDLTNGVTASLTQVYDGEDTATPIHVSTTAVKLDTVTFQNSAEYFTEIAGLSPPSTNQVALYAKSDGILYFQNDTGTEYNLGLPSLAMNDLTDVTISGVANNDIIQYSSGSAAFLNVTFASFEASLTHDNLAGFVANEHIDWTSTTSNFSTSGTAATGALSVTGHLNITGDVQTGTWVADDVGVAYGGTGRSSATAYAVICGGTTATAAHQSVVGTGTSGQVLTSNGASTLPTWQAASAGSAVTYSTTAGEALSAGDIVYMHTDGKVYKALANGTIAQSRAAGVAQSSVAADAAVNILVSGVETGLSSLTIGSVYYVDTTAGGVTATAPATSGDNIVMVGVALTTTDLEFKPQYMYAKG